MAEGRYFIDRLMDGTAIDPVCLYQLNLPRLQHVMSQLSVTPGNAEGFASMVHSVIASGTEIWAAFDKGENLVGTASLTFKRSMSHAGRGVAQIEDLVVDEPERGMGIGSALVQGLIRRARALGCYKIIRLGCKADLVAWYTLLGFHASGIEMRMDLE